MTIQDLKIICNLLSTCKWVVARSLDVNTGDYQLKIEKSILTVAQSVRNLFYSGEGLTLETWAVSRSPSRAEWYTLLNFQLITIQCWTNIYGCARPLICIWTVIYNLQDPELSVDIKVHFNRNIFTTAGGSLFSCDDKEINKGGTEAKG